MVENVHIELEIKQEKIGKIWEHRSFICSNKNAHIKECKCKPISEKLIIDAVKSTIQQEIEKVNYSDKELSNLYKYAQDKTNIKVNNLNNRMKDFEKKLEANKLSLQEVYNDKLQGIIDVDDFDVFYKKLQKEKRDILNEIEKIQLEKIEAEKGNNTVDFSEIRKIANEVLSIENPEKELYAKLIEKIEFDSQKNIIVTLTFCGLDLQPEVKDAV